MNAATCTRLRGGLLLLALATGSAMAGTWYVDDDNIGKVGLDGTTEETAFATIADAVTNSLLQVDDKVIVLPGVYTNGIVYTTTFGSSRVYINKRMRLESRDGKDVTHIVGAPSPVTGTVGTNAIRCILVSHLAKQTVVKGFTLRDGYTDSDSRNGENSHYRGGAFFCNSSDNKSWLVDCVISNCVSRQANMYQGTAYRCWFTHNWTTATSGENIALNAYLHSCLVSDNITGPSGTGTYTMFNGRAVNCTFACNDMANGVHGRASVGNLRLYNTVVTAGERMLIQNNALVSANCSTNDEYQLVAPALGDFRVLAGGPADGTGDLRWVTDTEVGVPLPDDEPLKDLNGNPYPESGPIHIGAIQETVEAKGKSLRINHYLSVEGQRVRQYDSYLYPTEYPKTYRVKPYYADGADVVGYNLAPAERNWRFPEPDGGFTVMPPPLDSTRTHLYIQPVKAAKTIYVEMPENGGSDTTGDGTAASPFASIQKAVDSVTGSTAADYAIVSVGPGTYGEGEAHRPTDLNGAEMSKLGLASVTVVDKTIRIVGREGAARTILKGTPDPDYANEASLPGCGPNAGRCAIFSGDKCNGIQGFTLTGGHGARENVSSFSADYGGAWYSSAGRAVIADCIISNNAARAYGAGSGGQMVRCLVTDNRSAYGTVGATLMASACVFRDDPSACNTYGTIGPDAFAFHCTIIGYSSAALGVRNQTSAHLTDSIIYGGAALGASADIGEVLAWDVAGTLPAGAIRGNPLFVDMAGGDLRVMSLSPAARMGRQTGGVLYQYISTDFTGTPMDFTDGWPTVGAYQETVASSAKVYIQADHGGVSVSGGEIGMNALAAGAIAISPANGPRPCFGYAANGVTNLLSDLPGGVLEVAAAQVASDGIYVEALYDANWYVDAENGADGSPGFSIMPKKTLAAIMALAQSGDTVHAAPGDYNEGQMGQNATCVISSRVVVVSGVTLKADQGPDVTFISGADATIDPVASGNYAGCGANALRCVYLNTNSRVEGFTVRNGRFNGLSPDTADSRSGGVYGYSSDNSVAYGCVITNCWGFRGGGCYGCVAVNCRFIDNRSNDGSAGKCAALYGCHLIRGYITSPISSPRGAGIVNCTISGENMSSVTGTGKVGNIVAYSEAKYPLRNCIILGAITATEARPFVLENCVLATGLYDDASVPYLTMTDCIVTNLEAIAVGADGRLEAGSVAIDHGDNAKVEACLADKDAAIGQRIYNGNVDVGAYEYDWRASYARTIHPSRCAVTAASPDVLQGEGKVLVSGTLDATFSGVGGGRRYSVKVPVNVTGNGRLDIVSDGAVLASYTLANGAQTFVRKSVNDTDAYSFVYVPGESDTGCAEIGSALWHAAGFSMGFR